MMTRAQRVVDMRSWNRAHQQVWPDVSARPASGRTRLSCRPASTRAPAGREYLFGAHSCACALAARSRTVHRVYAARAATERGGDAAEALDAIVAAATARGVPVMWTDRQHVGNLAQQPASIVMDVSPLVPRRVDDAAELDGCGGVGSSGRHALVVCLDEVQDPHNVGAIVRSALLLGADWVVGSARNAAPFNATVSRTSAGALEHLAGARRLGSTESMPALLADCAARGWRVLGAAAPPRGDAVDAADADDGVARRPALVAEVRSGGGGGGGGNTDGARTVPRARPWLPAHALRLDAPTVLVLGNEGRGLRTNVARACTAFAYVPMRRAWGSVAGGGGGSGSAMQAAGGAWAAVDSLNVSAAAAVLLHQLGGSSGGGGDESRA